MNNCKIIDFDNEDEVKEFIRRFCRYEENRVLEQTFTEGMCYYFAIILQERFGGEILYDKVENHFVTLIKGKLYDITGNVTNMYVVNGNLDLDMLLTKSDWMRDGMIIRNVILKVDG